MLPMPIVFLNYNPRTSRDVPEIVMFPKSMLRAIQPLLRTSEVLSRYYRRLRRKDRFHPLAHPRLHIETTNFCNADCVFCANSVMTRRVESLKPDLFESAVTQFAGMGGTSLDFNVTIGDPLLDKRLLRRAKFAKSKNMTGLGFVTTLQWLHIHSVREVVELFDWISVSTTLSGRDSYRAFFGVDLYERMLTNLKELIRAKDKWNPKFELHIAIKPTDETLDVVVNHPDFVEINRLHHQDLEKTIESRSIFVDDWGGSVKLPNYLKKRPRIPRFRRPCRFLYETLHVHSNGKVAGCACRDFNADSQLIIGDLRKDTLPEIWNGAALDEIRSEWRSRNRVPEICKTCRFYQF